jgi:hypothetical protein
MFPPSASESDRFGGARTVMDAQKTAIDAVVVLTGCDRDMVTRVIRSLYLSGVRDAKRLTFKGLQFAAGAAR